MIRKICTVFFTLTCLCFLVAQFRAAAQGNEYQRSRSADWTTPLIGSEIHTQYRIGISDSLNVSVWKNPELSKTVTVNPDGKISMPLIGQIKAADLTLEELQDTLKDKYSKYVRYPVVTVTVESMAGQKILVFGQVMYPGVFTYEGQINLVDAIAMAGGMTKAAKRESVIIVSDNMTENPKARRVNLFLALRKGTSDPDFILKANDIIYVPANFIADFTYYLEQFKDMTNYMDDLTDEIWDWRKEVKWFYERNVSSPKRQLFNPKWGRSKD